MTRTDHLPRDLVRAFSGAERQFLGSSTEPTHGSSGDRCSGEWAMKQFPSVQVMEENS